MALSQFSFLAKTIQDMQGWFVDIVNHLSAKNYDNQEYTPVITGMTGSPTVTAWYQRFGKKCEIWILLNGTHTILSGTITLPLTPTGYGTARIHSITDNSSMGTAEIDSSTGYLLVKSYWATDETVLINGIYEVAGI